MQFNGSGSAKRQSAWAQMESWRAKRSQMAQQFLSESSEISSRLTNAQINLSTGRATLAAESFSRRLQTEAAARRSGVNVTI